MPQFGTYQTPLFKGSGKQISTVNVGDFTGGLNLRADQFSLGQNESPDLLNVNVDPRGGVIARDGTEQWGPTSHDEDLVAAWRFDTPTVAEKLIGQDSTHLMVATGGTWTDGIARTGTIRSTQMKDKIYFTNGSDKVVTYDGTNWVELTDPAATAGAGWNESLDAPVGGFAVKGRATATHMGCLFMANTLEDGTRYPNRVRWSHPNQPQDWADFHYIDIDIGADGDEIVGLVPFTDRLLVFKKKSIYAIYGEPPEAFQVFPVSREVGAISQEAIATSDIGVYFFSWSEGVYLFDGKQTQWEFDRLLPLIDEHTLTAANADKIRLGWDGGRLHVACPVDGATSNNATFVLDPRLTKEGSWVKYDIPALAFLLYSDGVGTSTFAFSANGYQTLMRYSSSLATDQFADGAEWDYPSYYQTRWLDLNEPGILKRYKRPDFVITRGVDADINVEVYKDYDPGHAFRNFTITAIGVGDTALFGTAVFGTDVFSSDARSRHSVERGSPLGTARAVSLRFSGPTSARWGVAGMTLKIIPKKVRG